MHEPSPTRRRLLQAGAALGATALAGCLGGGDDGGSGLQPATVVPDGSRYAVHADVSALLADEALRTSINDFLDQFGGASATTPAGGPASVSEALDQVEETVGLDPRDVSGAVGFGGYEPSTPAGAVLWSDWSLADVRGALNDSGVEPGTETYNGHDVVVATDGLIAELADGTVAVGQRSAVESAVDVAAGDAAAVGGDLQAGLEAASDGALRLAFEAPDDVGQGTTTVGGVDPAVFQSLTHGYGAYVVDGGSRRSYLTLETGSADDASALQSALETLLAQARQQLSQANAQRPMVGEMRSLLAATEVSRSGASVTLSASDSEVVPLLLVAVLTSFVLGLGSSQEPVPPQAVFEVEYDAQAGLVTVTHAGGDHVRADALAVRGQGIGAAEGADMTAPGEWAGSTSGDVDGVPAVTAGDSVTVGVTGPDYVLRMVWESPDGSTSATLDVAEGPEA